MVQIDHRIAMMGQQPNILNALAQGTQAAGQVAGLRRQAEGQNLFRQHGAGIVNGDPAAMNALAQFSPETAFNMNNQRAEQMRADRQLQISEAQLGMAREAAAKAVRDASSAEAAAAEVQKAQGLYKQAVMAFENGDEAGWRATVGQFGMDLPMEDGSVRLMGAMLGGAAEEVGKLYEQPKPADEYGRYAQEEAAAGRQPLDRISYAQAKKGQETIFDRDGNPIVSRGPAALPKTTEGEKSAAGYLSRMRASEKIMDELSVDEPAVRNIASLLIAGTDFEGLVLSNRQQKILQAQRDWVRAKLRKESGAVIGADEMAEEVRTYFPLPGEGPEVIAQKKRSRLEAERQFEIMGGNAAPQAKGADSEISLDMIQSEVPPEFVSDDDRGLWAHMTPLERHVILEAYK